MQPIDRPFRFTVDFCVAWLLLVAPSYLLLQHSDMWHARWDDYIILFLLSLFATFLIYGPILLVNQIVRSGSRGWLVAKTLLSILIMIILLFGALYISGHGRDVSSIWGGVAACAATFYLHLRTGERKHTGATDVER